MTSFVFAERIRTPIHRLLLVRNQRLFRAAFTLIELLIVLAVLAIVVALTLAVVQRARNAAARLSCANNLRQLAIGVHSFSSQGGLLPQGCAYPRGPGTGISWQTSILPQIEQNALWEKAWSAYLADPILGNLPVHKELMNQPLPILMCPADGRSKGGDGLGSTWALTSYVGVAGTGRLANNGVFHPSLSIALTDILDGTSNTVMIGERPPGVNGAFSGWYANWGNCTCPVAQILHARIVGLSAREGAGCPDEPALTAGQINNACSVWHFWSLHSTGANFAFADGSVRFLSYSKAGILPALATRSGGEPEIPLD